MEALVSDSGEKERSTCLSTSFSLRVKKNDRADAGREQPNPSRETEFAGAIGDREI